MSHRLDVQSKIIFNPPIASPLVFVIENNLVAWCYLLSIHHSLGSQHVAGVTFENSAVSGFFFFLSFLPPLLFHIP